MRLKKGIAVCLSIVLLSIICGGCSSSGSDENFIFTDRHSSVELKAPCETESFSFVIFADRTCGYPAGLVILKQAVQETNVVNPDFVINIGDMVNGYNQTEEWIAEADEYKGIMNDLEMPWYPTAGNHDIYWRGDNRPAGDHDQNYEQHFGPLWYAFEHKNCWFIVLDTDEGHPETGKKGYPNADYQQFSERQLAFLEKALQKAQKADHVFLFMHHPRWTKDRYCPYADNWEPVQKLLKEAGNVSACFAGHTHRMIFDGVRDGVQLYTVSATGGKIPDENQGALTGYLHHVDLVTVRGNEFHVAAIPVGSVIDPKARIMSQTLVSEKWYVSNEEKRRLEYAVSIPNYEGVSADLKISVWAAADDTGDLGIDYALCDGDGNVMRHGFLKSDDKEAIDCSVKPGQQLKFVLTDDDTRFDGKYPGNGGRLSIELEVRKYN